MEIDLEPTCPRVEGNFYISSKLIWKIPLILMPVTYLAGGEGCRVRNSGQCSTDQFKCKNENKNQILSINDFNKEREKCIPLYYRCDGRFSN